MKKFTRGALILMLAALATISLRVPGYAGWFSSDDADESENQRLAQLYDEGTKALEDSEWEEAIEAFDEVAESGGSRADGALYWKAYALSKLHRRSEALSSIERLANTYPKSKWKDDAKALAMELRQSKGKPVEPEEDDSEELKLLALNSLMNSDPDQAVPMLERFLAGNHSRRLKEQALFVMVQSGSSRARALVEKTARGQANPALQRKAVELLGIFGGEDSSRVLRDIYTTTGDDQVKKQILNAYMVSGDTASLLAVAKMEKNESLRRDAISLLGAQGAEEELAGLYASETSRDLKRQILQALAVAGSDKLPDLARHEKDPELRRQAVQSLGIMDHDIAGPALLDIYATEKDTDIRRAVLQAFMVQGNDTALIKIAKTEKDPTLRREAVQQLSVMGTKEATEYLMQLLED